MDAVTQSLPGVRFAPRERTRARRSRLDVAGFVGLAERGPLDRAVRVASFQEFDAIFGRELSLARTSDGELVRGQLRASVASYFQQGGRAAWIVRVAGADAAPATFAIPGVALLTESGFTDATAHAAWPGSFGDALGVAAAVELVPLPLDTLRVTDEGDLEVASDREHLVSAGSTLMLSMDGADYLVGQAADGSPGYCLATRSSASPMEVDTITVLDPGRSSLGSGRAVWSTGAWNLVLDTPPATPPSAGEVLLLAPASGGGQHVMGVDDCAINGEGSYEVTASALYEELPTLPPAAAADQIRTLHRVKVSLDIYEGDARAARIGASDLVATSAAYAGWRVFEQSGTLKSDRAEPAEAASAAYREWILSDVTPRAGESLEPLSRRALSARIAPVTATTAGGTTDHSPTWVPVGLLGGALRGVRGPTRSPGTDGLTSIPRARFVDPALATAAARSLHASAQALRHPIVGAEGRRLRGAHALLDVREIAMLAAPDTALPDWVDVEPDVLETSIVAIDPPVTPCAGDFRPVSSTTDAPEPTPPQGPATEGTGPTVEAAEGDLPLAGLTERASLLDAQAALAAMAEARGDVLAVMTLPRTHRVEDLLEWRRAFRSRVGLPTVTPAGEDARQIADLGLVCAIHPWIVVAADDGDGYRTIPPAGALCGVIARREHHVGPWASPGSGLVHGALGLDPALERAELERLAAEQIVTLEVVARNTSFLGAPTQSDVTRLLPIAVRRLLQFVRRECERLGERWAFEANGDELEEDVRVELTALLEGLFERGALAGQSTAEAFELAVGGSVDPTARERGELVVRLRLAPSYPLEFIEVHLVRTGDELVWSIAEA